MLKSRMKTNSNFKRISHVYCPKYRIITGGSVIKDYKSVSQKSLLFSKKCCQMSAECCHMTTFRTTPDNHKEGRKFWVYASVVDGGNPRNYQRNFFINSRDGQMNWNNASNGYISKIYSEHHNSHYKDRRWRLCHCWKQ